VLSRTVSEELQEHTWVSDIRNALGLLGLAEYFELWDMVSDVNLSDTEDIHRWKPKASSLFLMKSAYTSYFLGSITLNLGRDYGSLGRRGNTKPLCG
jgi:hypothetical protein